MASPRSISGDPHRPSGGSSAYQGTGVTFRARLRYLSGGEPTAAPGIAVSVLVSLPLGGTRAAQPAPSLTARHVQSVDALPLLANNWTDEEWGLSIAPPAWW